VSSVIGGAAPDEVPSTSTRPHGLIAILTVPVAGATRRAAAAIRASFSRASRSRASRAFLSLAD